MPHSFHASLKALPVECAEWMAHAAAKGKLASAEDEVGTYLAEGGIFAAKAGHALWDLAHYFAIATCDAFLSGDEDSAARFLNWAVGFRSLRFRMDGTFSERNPTRGNWPKEYEDSLRAAGPAMLSHWDLAAVCARRYLEMAEKDQRINTFPGSRRIAHNTSDVFLVSLFSDGLHLPTEYRSTVPLVPAYQSVLDCWRTADAATYAEAMRKAAEFHISRGKDSTGSVFYEFDHYFDRLFPAELITVQALRQKEGLLSLEAGHELIDVPWAFIQAMPQISRHPLDVAVEARMKADYPQFR